MPQDISHNRKLFREYKRTPLEQEVVDLKTTVKDLEKKISQLESSVVKDNNEVQNE